MAPNTGIDEGYAPNPRCSVHLHRLSHANEPREEDNFPNAGSDAHKEQIAERLSYSSTRAGRLCQTAEFGGSERFIFPDERLVIL